MNIFPFQIHLPSLSDDEELILLTADIKVIVQYTADTWLALSEVF